MQYVLWNPLFQSTLKILNHDHTLSTFSSWIFFNNYKYDWEQKDYIYFSKLLEKYSPKIEEENSESTSITSL